MTIPALWHAEWTAPLVNHLWQSTAVVAVAWLLALALRRNHASTRYWVWMAASLKFLVPFWLLIGAGEWARSLLSAPPSPPPALAAAMGQIAQPFSQEQFFGAAGLSAAARRADLLPAILLAIWACGTLIVLFRWMRGWLRVRAAVRSASPLKIAADIPALSSTAPIEPGIFGIFRPVLLLPAGVLNRLTPAQLNAIVAHEMCHARRRDNLTFALHVLVEALFWFHPAVWWIGARLIEERERACDEAVVQAGEAAEIYAEGILNICKFYVESPLACVAGITGADLKKRVVRIMSQQVGRRLSRGRKLALAVAGLAAMFGLLLVGMIDAPLSFARQSTTAFKQDQGTHLALLASSGLAARAQNVPIPPAVSAEPANPSIKLPAYDVASIKPSNTGTNRARIMNTPDGFSCSNTNLKTLIANAYGIRQDAIFGGPSWVDSAGFDIQAKVSGHDIEAFKKLNPQQRDSLLQALLADRFHLQLHHETRVLPMYNLVIAKGGSKLKPSAPFTPPPDAAEGSNAARGPRMTMGGAGTLHGEGLSMDAITNMLSYVVHYTVVDKTGLTGDFNFDLKWQPDGSGPSANSDDAGVSIFTAVQEQLGLKLQPTKGSVDTLVIDRVEKPSGN